MIRQSLALIGTVIAVVAAGPGAARAADEADKGPPPKPPLPAIEELKIIPDWVTLEDARDARGVLVSGRTAEGTWIDLTDEANLSASTDKIEIDSEGLIHPRIVGETEVTITAAGLDFLLPVTVTGIESKPVKFVRDIMPLISRIGCNAGTCHGGAQGKNGFALSLRGFDPDFDYNALVNDLSGRRFNRAVPEQSLMLLKPTSVAPHEGGRVLIPGSPYYRLFLQWIAEGVEPPDGVEGRAISLEVLPSDVELSLPGMTQRLLVLAHYADGSVRDVTREAVFTTNKLDIASVSEKGGITALRRGEAAVLVRYEGNYATRGVVVMGDRDGFEWSDQAGNNYIDELVNAKLKRLKILASKFADDAEFIRRIYLDLTGTPPDPETTRQFLADESPIREKRDRVIDELLASKDYVNNWTNKWADLLQCNEQSLGEKGVWLFREWIHDAIETNMAYDEFARELINAQGSAYKNPAANYFRTLREPSKATEDVSQVFLGVRFQCAKCHDHPFEKWTQNQYYQFGAFFSRVGIKKGQMPGEEIVYTRFDGGEVVHPKTGLDIAPKTPFGAVDSLETNQRVTAFADWLTSAENPLFARAMANRVWSYFFSRGIIDPVDDIRTSNPPSNPALLDALTRDFVAGGFDVRSLMRRITRSETYQRSIQTNRWNEDDAENFSHAIPRRLSAEELLEAIATSTGTRPKFEGLPEGLRPAEIASGMVKGDKFLALFGRPQRKSSCECERTNNVSLSHILNLINGPTVGEAIAAPGSRLADLVNSDSSDADLIDEIYLAVLCRPSTPIERQSIHLGEGDKRLEGAQDLTWVLINSPSFLFNR